MAVIETISGMEVIESAELIVNVWYVNHKNCPILFDQKSANLNMISKTGKIGPRGDKITKIQSIGPTFLNPRNERIASTPTLSKIAKPSGWYKNSYECPNGLIIKVDMAEKSKTFGARHYRGIMFLKVRDTGPYVELTFKKGHGIETLIRGRFDRLSPAYVCSNELLSHFSEATHLDEHTLDDFVNFDITKPALKEVISNKETLEIDGEIVEIIKPKSLRKVSDF